MPLQNAHLRRLPQPLPRLPHKRDGSSRIVAIVGARSEGSGSVIGAAWEGNHWLRARFTQKGLQEVRAWKKKNQHAALPDQSK